MLPVVETVMHEKKKKSLHKDELTLPIQCKKKCYSQFIADFSGMFSMF